MSPRISISLLAAQSDQRLLALARAGNERAFEALVQRYRRPLLRYCRRMRLSDTRAEDVVQQAFLRAWTALVRGGEVRELRPWLYRITHNAAVNAMRGQAESHGELTDAAQARAALSRESNLERTIAVREALGEVAELPRMQRQAIFLTAVDGQTHDEVASTLGISHGALRGLLYRARATLRDAAAALTPPPLLSWASRGAGAAAPTAERVADLTAGGGAVGVAGVLLKGAVVAVTAGALATGASVIASDQRGTSLHRDASSRVIATPSAAPPVGNSGRLAGAGPPLLDALGADRAGGERGGGHRAHRRGRALARARHGARHARGGDPHDGGDPAERDAAARGERSPGGDEDSLGGGRGKDGGDDGGGSTSATGGRQGADQRGHGKSPSAGSDPPGRSGSGGGSDADTTPGGQAQGGSGGGESSGSDASGDDGNAGSRSGGANGAEAELAAASGVDSTSASGSLGGESASDGERSGGGSGEASGHAGAGANG